MDINKKNKLEDEKKSEVNFVIEDESFLETIGKIAPIFQQLVPIENMIGITNKEKFLYYFPSKELNMGDLEGKPMPNGSLSHLAIQTGNLQHKIVPKEVYGTPVKSISIPLKDKQGNIIGTVNLAISLKNEEILSLATETIASSSEELAATSEELAASSEQLLLNVREIDSFICKISSDIERTKEIIEFVNKISSNSKLLSFNAAIEAARAGEAGKGFSVVANEIQKMAEESKNSVMGIKEILEKIRLSTDLLKNKLDGILQITQSQAAATEEIAASAARLASSTDDISKVAKII